ncbi:acetyl-CoA carboxylase, carboxyltransferase subunit beta [Chlamydiota bacterium]
MWFFRRPHFTKKKKKKDIPRGLWTKCKKCESSIYSKEWRESLSVCPKCGYHGILSAWERIEFLTDPDSFKEIDHNIEAVDILEFFDTKAYKDRIKAAVEKTGLNEAIVTGTARINDFEVALGVMDFRFIGGSMGSVVGEKVTRLIELAIEKMIPLIIVSSSGGARMQESTYSLMQMAKTSAALAKLHEKGLLYISVMTDPTTGGTTASFASLGDVIIAEPGALIGFAGPRVIKQTIQQDLPEGFQRAEFLLEHGFIDAIIERKELKKTITSFISLFVFNGKAAAEVRGQT